MSRIARLPAFVTRTAIWIPAAIIALLFVPIALTHRSFGHDWTLHLWLIRQQQWNIEATSHPTMFVSAAPIGAFYPVFAFTGSGLYAVGGYLAIALGNRPLVAYKLMYLAGLCLAYGGMTWTAVQLGLRGWRSQIPGLVFVTGAYVITDMVGRGDLGEFMALSAIPFLIAATCAFLTARSVRRREQLAVVLAVFVLTASHNVTLVWGSVFLVLIAAVALLAWRQSLPSPLPEKRVWALVGVAVIGGGLNAWYLFADVAYGLDTVIGRSTNQRPAHLFIHPGALLNPLRPADQGGSPVARDIRLALPWMFFLWALFIAIALWRGRDSTSRRLFAGFTVVALGFVGLLVSSRPWKLVPRVFYTVQFTWRLDAYVLLATALVVMVALLWQARADDALRRWTTVVLVAIAVFNVGAATWQIARVRSEFLRVPSSARPRPIEVPTSNSFVSAVISSRYIVPPSWYGRADFRDTSTPVVQAIDGNTVTVPVDKVHGASFSGTLAVPNGRDPFVTNISAGSRFVHMTGITPVGRTLDGYVVAVRSTTAPAHGPVDVTIGPAHSLPLRSGAVFSVASALALVVLILWPRRRRSA